MRSFQDFETRLKEMAITKRLSQNDIFDGNCHEMHGGVTFVVFI